MRDWVYFVLAPWAFCAPVVFTTLFLLHYLSESGIKVAWLYEEEKQAPRRVRTMPRQRGEYGYQRRTR